MTPEQMLAMSVTPPTFDPAKQGGIVPMVSAPQQSIQPVVAKPSTDPVGDVSLMIAPQAGLGAMTGNPIAGGLGGAGISLLEYFIKKYRSGKQQ